MNIKIKYHIMPWEIDYALLTFSQLKKSLYHLSQEDNIEVSSVLNLSSYIINWEESKLPKEYFIQKYQDISKMLEGYKHTPKIYDEDQLYGHLDFEKEIISPEVDYYISICPDICFSEYALSYLIESAKQVENKYFVITPQISKVGDEAWDEITNSHFVDTPYEDYLKVNVFDVYNTNHLENEKNLYPTLKSKFAGWFDLYSKSVVEELCPMQEDWEGYGPWDLYSIILTNHLKNHGVDFQQYLIQGEVIWMYPSGPLIGDGIDGFSGYYKNLLVKNPIPDQRQKFESNLNLYLQKTLVSLKNKNII
jgi:hypothetical protein